jgi:hypothetical protein
MSRDDALAIRAYLNSLPPQHVVNKDHGLSFPFNQRKMSPNGGGNS